MTLHFDLNIQMCGHIALDDSPPVAFRWALLGGFIAEEVEGSSTLIKRAAC